MQPTVQQPRNWTVARRLRRRALVLHELHRCRSRPGCCAGAGPPSLPRPPPRGSRPAKLTIPAARARSAPLSGPCSAAAPGPGGPCCPRQTWGAISPACRSGARGSSPAGRRTERRGVLAPRARGARVGRRKPGESCSAAATRKTALCTRKDARIGAFFPAGLCALAVPGETCRRPEESGEHERDTASSFPRLRLSELPFWKGRGVFPTCSPKAGRNLAECFARKLQRPPLGPLAGPCPDAAASAGPAER